MFFSDDTVQKAAIQNISGTIRNDLRRMCDIWKEMGLNHAAKTLYCEQVHGHIKVSFLFISI